MMLINVPVACAEGGATVTTDDPSVVFQRSDLTSPYQSLWQDRRDHFLTSGMNRQFFEETLVGASIFQTAYMIPSALHITITVPRASTVYVLATDPKGHWGVKLKTDAGWTAEEWSSAFNQPVWSKLFAAGASETLPPTTAGTMGSSNHVTVLVQAETRGANARAAAVDPKRRLGVVQATGPSPSPSPSPTPSPSPEPDPEPEPDCDHDEDSGKEITLYCPHENILMEHCYKCFWPPDKEVIVCDGWSETTIRLQCDSDTPVSISSLSPGK
jgi:hypothetical protein